MEDLDRPRCVPGAAYTILRLLVAFGLLWVGTVLYQSQRDDAYAAALDARKACGAVYPCACTRSQLAQVTRNHEGEILYPGTCRNGLPPGTIARAWRVRVAAQPAGAGWSAWRISTVPAASPARPTPSCASWKPTACTGTARCSISRSVTMPMPRPSMR